MYPTFKMEGSASHEYFRVPTPDEKEISTNLKLLVDHDMENFRKGLWALEGGMFDMNKGYYWQPDAAPPAACLVPSCLGSQSPCMFRPSHIQATEAEAEEAPLNNNTSPSQKPASNVEAILSPDTIQENLESATTQQTPEVQSFTSLGAREERQSVDTPPLTPIISTAVREESISSISSISGMSVEESISEDHRREVARRQYYQRSGILWDCAAQLLEKHSLHPTNLTVYEFTKLVCIEGVQVFAWIETNRRFLINRATGQWLQANALLRNNADLNGLNANFMDDFLWMAPEHQVAFIRSYKRLQLEATALREGVKLPKSELDALCTMSEDEKLAIIHAYKEDGIKPAAKNPADFSGSKDEHFSESPEGSSVKADNLHLKFLHFGLGLEKYPEDLVGATKKVDATSCFRTVDNVPTKVRWASNDHDTVRNLSEASSSDTCVIDVSEPSHSTAPSLETPRLQRHKSSYRDLRAFFYQNSSSQIYDEGSDCDFTPPKSLRKKAGKFIETVKKSFTMTSIGRKRQSVKDYF